MNQAQAKARLRAATMLAGLVYCPCARGAIEQATHSDQFVDTIGVNIHAMRTSGPYGNIPQITQVINDLGIRYVRDIPDAWDRINQITAATGTKVMIIMQEGETTPTSITMDKLPAVMQRAKNVTAAAFLEGPNEREAFANWQQPLLDWQSAMYQQAKADPVLSDLPVVGPSLSQWAPNVPDLYDYVDGGNLHHYGVFSGPITYYLPGRIAAAQTVVGQKPIYVTETGYHNSLNWPHPGWTPVSESVGAKYQTQGFFDLFNAGIKQSYVYQLVQDYVDPNNSEIESGLALVRNDWSYKPVAHAIKNLITLLEDPGAEFSPASLDFNITGGDANLKHSVLQKRDGSFYVALWQDVFMWDWETKQEISIPAQSVTVNFAQAMNGAEVYLPTQSVTPINLHSGAISQLNLSVPGELLLVRVGVSPDAPRTWNANAGGNWRDGSNWVFGVPDAVGAQANLTSAITAARAVAIDGAGVTVGTLTFSNANSYSIGGSSSLTIQSATTGLLDVQQGTHSIALPLTFASDTTINAAAGATLRMTDAVTINAGKQVSQTGAGAVKYELALTLQTGALLQLGSSQQMSALIVGNDAQVTLAAGGTRVLRSDGVAISAAGGKIDLKNNKLITATAAGTWNGSSYTGIAGQVKSARGNGTWNGAAGITTSMPDAATGITTLAVTTAGEIGKTTFAGQSVSSSDTLVMYTFAGDANLSGSLDADDYFAIDSNQHRSGSLFGFVRGDFNYDGLINGDDYLLIDAAYAAQAGGFTLVLPALGATAVPEPGTLCLALLAAMAHFTPRRR